MTRGPRSAAITAWTQADAGRDIGSRYGRHERRGRMVKRSGLTGELGM
jgi:hypothetical protein